MRESIERARLPRAKGKASTTDVLGVPVKNGKVSSKWAEQYRHLSELRDRLSGDKSAHTENAKEEVSNFSEHMADAATDSYDRDWALAMLSSGQNALYEIDQALKRIHEGTYGVCEATGKPIEPARLKAIPWTRFSAEAQAELEARGLSFRTALGELGVWSNSTDTQESDDDEGDETAGASLEKKAA